MKLCIKNLTDTNVNQNQIWYGEFIRLAFEGSKFSYMTGFKKTLHTY